MSRSTSAQDQASPTADQLATGVRNAYSAASNALQVGARSGVAATANINNPGAAPFPLYQPALGTGLPDALLGNVWDANERPIYIEHSLTLKDGLASGAVAHFQLAQTLDENKGIIAFTAGFSYATITSLEFTLQPKYAGRGRWWEVWYATRSSRDKHDTAFTAADVRSIINANFVATNPVGEGAAPIVTKALATSGQGFSAHLGHSPVLGGSLRYLIHIAAEAGVDVPPGAKMAVVWVRAVVRRHTL